MIFEGDKKKCSQECPKSILLCKKKNCAFSCPRFKVMSDPAPEVPDPEAAEAEGVPAPKPKGTFL